MTPFQRRLTELKEAAGFTQKDTAVWCGGVSWQSVGTWLAGTRKPKDYRRKRIEKALEYLQRELDKARSELPIPLHLKEGERRAYVERVRKKYPAC